MAATQVGTPVSSTPDTNGVASVSSPTKSVTSGNLLISVVKIEFSGKTFNTPTDTAGNTWVIIDQRDYQTVARRAMAYAFCTTTHATNAVTWSWTGGNADFCCCSQDEWSGLATSNVLDGSFISAAGATRPWVTGNIVTNGPGLVYIGVGLYNAYSALSGTPGNPDFTANTLVTEIATGYLISASAQTVTPGLTATGPDDNWGAVAQSFKELVVVATGYPIGQACL